MIHEIFQSDNPAEYVKEIGYDKATARVTDNTGSSRLLDTIEEVDKLVDAACSELGAKKVCRFAQDGLSHVIASSVNTMSEDSFAEWIQYLIATAERPDLMGFSDHIVQVLVK